MNHGTNTSSTSKLRPEDTVMEMHASLVRVVLYYLRDVHGEAAAAAVLARTGLDWAYVETRNNWVSYACYCRLLAAAVAVTGEADLPFNAGLRNSNYQSFGVIEQIIRHLGTPATAYRLTVQFNHLWNKIGVIEMQESRRNSCVLRVRLPRHRQDRNNCRAIQGCLATGPILFGLPPAKVIERQCACDGADACVYELHWVNRPPRKRALCGAGIGLLLGGIVASAFPSWRAIAAWGLTPLLAVSGFMAGRLLDYKKKLLEVYHENEKQAKSLLISLQDIEALNRELQSKVELRTAELSQTNQALREAMEELRTSQAMVIQRERQAAVGVLAGGMAHEMNNPINAIQLSLQALHEDLAQDPGQAGILATAGRATRRCKRIVNELLSFSRDSQSVVPVDMRDIVRHAVELFQKEAPEGIRVVMRISHDLPKLSLDQAQVQQAILNLFANASDAMTGKGLIEVVLASDGADAVLTVRDHGPGMDAETLDRSFDPFFSTKHGRGGLGLGLAITCQLVHRNGGVIHAVSRKGEGATFTLRFPVRGNTGTPARQNGMGSTTKG